MASIIENIFDLTDYEVVVPYIAIAEQADAQSQAQALQERLHQEMGTATGLGTDYDANPDGSPSAGVPQQVKPGFGLQRNPPANATPTGTLGTQ